MKVHHNIFIVNIGLILEYDLNSLIEQTVKRG